MSAKNQPPALKEDFISRLPTNKQHLIALVFILVLPFILYNSATLGGKKFMGHDTIEWRAGAESVFQYRAKHDGEEPLWATNMFSGMPAYVVSVNKSVYHLDTLISAVGRSIYPAAYYWVLMAGVYLFFILQGMRPLSSLLGSICISFTTYIPIILGAGHNTKFIAFVFIPWVLVGYWLLTRSNKKLLSFVAFAIALTLEFRAGHPQVTYYFFYLLAFWWLYDTWTAWQEDRLKPWLGTTALLAGTGLVALLGNAQQYWDLMSYSPYSIRGGSALAEGGGGGLHLEYAFNWSQGFGELLTLIIPGLFGGSSADGYWGPKPITSGPHYLGAIAFVLFLIGLFRSRHKLKYLFTGVGALTILFSLGYHFKLLNGFMFKYVPFFNKFRTPEMWLIVTVFCFSVVAVYGLEALIKATREKHKELKPLYAPLGIALAIGLIFALGSNALLSFEKPGERQQYAQQVARQNNVAPSNPQVQQTVSNFINTRLKPKRKEMASNDSVRYFIIVLLAGALIIALYKEKITPGYFLLAIVLIASYDYISVDNRYTNEDRMVSDRITTEQVIANQKRPLDSYIINHINSPQGYPYRVFPLSDNPFNNAIPSYFYPSIGGYSGAKLSYYQDLIENLLFSSDNSSLNMPVMSMLNVKYISSSQPLPFPGLKQVYSGDDGYVFENTNVLPKVFYADSLIYAGSAKEAMQKMKSMTGFNPKKVAVVEHTGPLQAAADTAATVEVTHYDARHISLKTNRSKPGFLVLSEIYYPKGWQAEIDGQATEIYKTNYVLRGLEIPAGSHDIKLAFNPRSYIWGGRIAWTSNLFQWGLGLFALALWYRRKEEKDEGESD